MHVDSVKCQLRKILVLYFNLPAARKNTAALVQYPAILPSHSANYIYIHIHVHQRNSAFKLTSVGLTHSRPNYQNLWTTVPMQSKNEQANVPFLTSTTM